MYKTVLRIKSILKILEKVLEASHYGSMDRIEDGLVNAKVQLEIVIDELRDQNNGKRNKKRI
jgi:hypothetical protein